MAGKLPRLSRLPIRNAPLQVASSLIDVAEVYSSDLSESEKTIAYGEAGGSWLVPWLAPLWERASARWCRWSVR